MAPHLIAACDLYEAVALAAQDDSPTAVGQKAIDALERRRAGLGPDHPLIALETRYVGEALINLDQYDAALDLYLGAAAHFERLGLDFDRAIVQSEIAYLHWSAARSLRHNALSLREQGKPYKELSDAFVVRRDQALRAIAVLESMTTTWRDASRSRRPTARLMEQARMAAIAMRIYALRSTCWSPMVEANRWLEDVCVHLEGSDKSCVAGRKQMVFLLQQGESVRRDGACVPEESGSADP